MKDHDFKYNFKVQVTWKEGKQSIAARNEEIKSEARDQFIKMKKVN